MLPHEQGFLSASLTMLLLLGTFLVILAILRYAVFKAPATVKIGKWQVEIAGPSWLVVVLLGAAMISAPVFAAFAMGPVNVTPQSASETAAAVHDIPDPTYREFLFKRDVSVLDLRAIESTPWYAQLPWLGQVHTRARLRPGLLVNTMIVEKVAPADSIHLVYASSGELDVRCTTHPCIYRRSISNGKGAGVVTLEVVADVSSVPVGSEFELGVEATYWNSFAGASGDDYTTYSHSQVDDEALSVTIIVPKEKPFVRVDVSESDSNDKRGYSVLSEDHRWGGQAIPSSTGRPSRPSQITTLRLHGSGKDGTQVTISHFCAPRTIGISPRED